MVYSAGSAASVGLPLLLPSVASDVVLHLPLALLVFVRLAVEKSLQQRRVRGGWQGVLIYLHRQG